MGFSKYPSPEHHTGLPYLADSFASHDATKVTFVAMNRGKCDREWEKSDAFGNYDDPEYHRFLCVFHGDGIDKVFILSDYVYSTRPHDPAYLIQCKIPEQFRHLVQVNQEQTSLHVDLHALEDLEAPTTTRRHIRLQESAEIDAGPRIENIPICHPASVHETNDKDLPANSFKLIAYTPIKSHYAINADKSYNWTGWSSVDRIPEWLEYHKYQGFEHFIIYDNDPEPNGPIHEKLKPYIQSGLVSYRWYPLENCMSNLFDRRMDEAQITGSLAAFHRIGYTAEYFSYHDGDEFFVPLAAKAPNGTSFAKKDTNRTVAELADNIFQARPDVDYLEWRAYLMSPCNGANVTGGGSIVAKWDCRTDENYASVKLILRTATMFYFCIHYAQLDNDGEEPKEYIINDETEGYLAHYRVQNEPDGQKRDDYTGMIDLDEFRKVDYFHDFLETRKLKQER